MRNRGGTLAALNVTKSYGAVAVLAGVSLVVPPRARIGVVGPNGSGKTTLLRLLAGLETPDEGRVERRPPSLSVGYLPQEPAVAGVAAPTWKRRKAAARLGLDLEPERPADQLSGGQMARARLAALLADEHDVLLLDEPTNDLDFERLAVLEDFVADTASALVVVSHDRAFLEQTVDRVLEFEAETRNVREFVGAWDDYERLRRVGHAQEQAAYDRYVAERGRFTDLLRERQGQARSAGNMASRRGTKALRSKVRSADRRLQRLERVEKPWEPWHLELELDSGRRPGNVVARLERGVVDRDGFRLGPIDLELRHGDRLAVLGKNGSGKTTLLLALVGELAFAAGTFYVGPGIRFGELEQRRSAFAGAEDLLETFRARSELPTRKARTLLAKFALGAEAVLRPASSLSPGERTRAGLALLAAQQVNVLVLDEPTNHLDLEAIDELEAALEGYRGTVVLVTHDRRLLERFEPTQTLRL